MSIPEEHKNINITGIIDIVDESGTDKKRNAYSISISEDLLRTLNDAHKRAETKTETDI